MQADCMRPQGQPAVVTPPRRTRGRPAQVSLEEIVTAAVALIDETGVDALTMRGLARSMGIGTMTLYRHVTDRQALLDLIPDALLAEVAGAVSRERTGLSALRAVAHGLAEVLQAHAGSARLFQQPQPGPNMSAAADQVLRLLVAEGLPDEEADVALRAVVAQVIGEVITVHGAVDLRGVELLLAGIETRLANRRSAAG